MTRRKPGHGSIERLPSGRFRARVILLDGERHPLGVYDTEEEADAMIAAALEEARAAGVEPRGGVTLRGIGPRFLDALELSGYVAAKNARSIWRTHIEGAPFSDWPLRSVERRQVSDWLRELAKKPVAYDADDPRAGRKLSPITVTQALVLLRKAFDWANDEELTNRNPAREARRAGAPASTEDPWTYLSIDEQVRLVTAAATPETERCIMAAAIGTGMRIGELWNLELRDVHVDGTEPFVFVRYGSKSRAPKNRRTRRVPLFGLGLAALRRWLELLPSYATNDYGLVFPGRRGGRRKSGEYDGWPVFLEAAGITRRVRFHDLRHTCGASLASGWWTRRPWRLEEVRDYLGHRSIKTTERYAHIAQSALRAAAEGSHVEPTPAVTVRKAIPFGSYGWMLTIPGEARGSEAFGALMGTPWPAEAHALADQVERAIAAGDAKAGLLAAELAAAVLRSGPVELARKVLAGGPHALDRALELAEAVGPLPSAEREREGTG